MEDCEHLYIKATTKEELLYKQLVFTSQSSNDVWHVPWNCAAVRLSVHFALGHFSGWFISWLTWEYSHSCNAAAAAQCTAVVGELCSLSLQHPLLPVPRITYCIQAPLMSQWLKKQLPEKNYRSDIKGGDIHTQRHRDREREKKNVMRR